MASRQRASHVEPVNPVLRWLFRTLRSQVEDGSPVAAFTRKWPCRWQADLALSGGPVLGPFQRRRAALAAEVAWLEHHILGGN